MYELDIRLDVYKLKTALKYIIDLRVYCIGHTKNRQTRTWQSSNSTPLRSGRVTDLKKKIFENILNLFCGTLICPLSIWQLEQRKSCNAFPWPTDVIQVLNELPTDKRHIGCHRHRLLCPTHAGSKKKQVFETNLFKCLTRPDLSGVPLNVSTLQTIENTSTRSLHFFVDVLRSVLKISGEWRHGIAVTVTTYKVHSIQRITPVW